VAQVALSAASASVRRFNAAFMAHYHLSPTQLRRAGATASPGRAPLVRLGYRPPYDVQAHAGDFLLRRGSHASRRWPTGAAPSLGRTLRVDMRQGRTHTGWLVARIRRWTSQVRCGERFGLREALPQVIRRVRAALDLDADPGDQRRAACAFPHGDGLRVPGTLDGFELAVRAVLGQQITVAAARTLAQRLVDRFGEPGRRHRLRAHAPVPRAGRAGAGQRDALGPAGHRPAAPGRHRGLAQAVAEQRLQLHGGADVPATITALKEPARHWRLDGAVHRHARAALARCLPGRRRGAAKRPGRARRQTPRARRRSCIASLEALAQLRRDPRLVRPHTPGIHPRKRNEIRRPIVQTRYDSPLGP
jgi:AraC family transcriptional regulator of adaptative response / DNA-3-methyladenine glycosylase II